MDSTTTYGQFCPLAMAAEFLCKRWMLLILRELLLGSSSFNDISRGVTRMSRSLLSLRLKELEQRGLVKKETKSNRRSTCYRLTESGKSLRDVVFGMAQWSQQWLHIEPSLENIDVDHLYWSIRGSARCHPDLPDPFVVNIYLPEQPPLKQNCWLLFEDTGVELCIIDHDFEVDVQLQASARDLVKVYLGWYSLSEAIEQGDLILHGSREHTSLVDKWFGLSRLATVKKQPENLRVF
ncbi:MAG TPA: transcriptional regulator [Aeromonadales bacterium]|nr:transcriptional regulator [Aeromonadales bacterium]